MPRVLIGAPLVFLGFGLALYLYLGFYDNYFFAWSVAIRHSPLVAVLIGGISAVLVGLLVLDSWSKFKFRHSKRLLTGASLIWLGFGAGLFGPALLGVEGSWRYITQRTENLVLINSVYYPLELQYIELPVDLSEFWSGENPGPYLALTSKNNLFVAVNSGPISRLAADDQISGGEVMLSSLSWPLAPKKEFSLNLSKIDPRIQLVRDLHPFDDGLMFSNVEVKNDCMVLQVWILRLRENQLAHSSLSMIWESSPCLDRSESPEGAITSQQSGGRLIQEPLGSILVTVGDFRLGLSTDKNFDGRPKPLTSSGSYGKILRIQRDGKYSVVSSGHRNPQGLFFDENTDRLWSSEHGPAHGDELNLITQGADYGWPDTTYGIPYRSEVPEYEWRFGRWGSRHKGANKPTFAWMPSIAPSQLIAYSGKEFYAWQEDILLATLNDRSIRRIRLVEDNVVFDERIEIGERVRDLVELPDGRLLLSFDSGRLGVLSLRITK